MVVWRKATEQSQGIPTCMVLTPGVWSIEHTSLGQGRYWQTLVLNGWIQRALVILRRQFFLPWPVPNGLWVSPIFLNLFLSSTTGHFYRHRSPLQTDSCSPATWWRPISSFITSAGSWPEPVWVVEPSMSPSLSSHPEKMSQATPQAKSYTYICHLASISKTLSDKLQAGHKRTQRF